MQESPVRQILDPCLKIVSVCQGLLLPTEFTSYHKIDGIFVLPSESQNSDRHQRLHSTSKLKFNVIRMPKTDLYYNQIRSSSNLTCDEKIVHEVTPDMTQQFSQVWRVNFLGACSIGNKYAVLKPQSVVDFLNRIYNYLWLLKLI